jgi:hypothetical protein
MYFIFKRDAAGKVPAVIYEVEFFGEEFCLNLFSTRLFTSNMPLFFLSLLEELKPGACIISRFT